MENKPKWFLFSPRVKDGKQEVRPPKLFEWFLFLGNPTVCIVEAISPANDFPILDLVVLDEDPREALAKSRAHAEEMTYMSMGYKEKAEALEKENEKLNRAMEPIKNRFTELQSLLYATQKGFSNDAIKTSVAIMEGK